MNSERLKFLIESARLRKDISQRELSKIAGISRSTLNDLINGKIKKVDIDDLRKIAEALDMSLRELLKVAGYDDFVLYFSKDVYDGKSSEDLKNSIEEYQNSEKDLLDFDYQKRKTVREARHYLFTIIEHLKYMQENKDSLYTVNKAIEDIQNVYDNLEKVMQKYDYNKLPKRFY